MSARSITLTFTCNPPKLKKKTFNSISQIKNKDHIQVHSTYAVIKKQRIKNA